MNFAAFRVGPSVLRGSGGASVFNVSKCFRVYNFDVMDDLAFGKSSNTLELSRNLWAIGLLSVGILPLALQLPVWLSRFGMNIRKLSRDWWKFIGFCRDSLQSRIKCEPEVSDIMSTLFDPLKGGDQVRRRKVH